MKCEYVHSNVSIDFTKFHYCHFYGAKTHKNTNCIRHFMSFCANISTTLLESKKAGWGNFMSSVKFSDSVSAKSNVRLAFVLAMGLLLSACGGGGGSEETTANNVDSQTNTEVEETPNTEPEQVAPVLISTHPQNLTLSEGDSATFSVAASGGGSLSFQWRKNQQVLEGATSSSITLTNVSEADAALYDVIVSNSAGSQNSLSALLTVNTAVVVIEEPTIEPVAINSHPQPIAINENETAIFTVSATGDGDLSYQWLKDGDLIEGATSSSLSIPSVSLSDAASYSVIVSNSQGPAISDAASLTVAVVEVVASIELTWNVPEQREDGSSLPLYEIDGYVIAYGANQNELTNQLVVDGASTTSTVLENLNSGTYYFSIATVDSDGVQGAYSSVIQQSI